MNNDQEVNQKKRNSGLKNSYLSSIEILAQSIASIAPSGTPTLVIPLVFAAAGNGTWLAYLFATIATILVGINLNEFNKRSASSGSLYSFIVQGLGSETGVISGWALVLAYLLTASAVLCGFINYTNVLLAYFGIIVSPVVIGIIGAAAAGYIAVKDIKLSAHIMLAFEIISLILIILLAAIVIVNGGFKIDAAQLALKGVTPSGIGTGLVLAFFSFVGFESAASLGDEAKQPLKTIPKAITRSVIFVGFFFVILSYTEVLGFIGSATALSETDAPLAELSNLYGVSFFGPLISIGALISFWASFLACTNAGARILFAMGRHGIFHKAIGTVHKTNKTPFTAITVSTIAAAVIPLLLVAKGAALFDIYGWTGTIATYGFILSYVLIAISTPLYLRKENELKKRHIFLSGTTVLILLIPIVGSVYANAQTAPYNAFIYIFIGWLAAGGIWFAVRKLQSPQVALNISEETQEVNESFKETRSKDKEEAAYVS